MTKFAEQCQAIVSAWNEGMKARLAFTDWRKMFRAKWGET